MNIFFVNRYMASPPVWLFVERLWSAIDKDLEPYNDAIKRNGRPRRKTSNIYLCFGVLLLVLGSLTLSCTKMPSNIGRSRDVVVISTKIDTNIIMNNLQIYNY
ncbi:MAG: hypothetical protein KAJ69_05730, partial [Thermoplasmatales archaeon]|nr:hypothetical protein [Thermoplasmatales archaeon]